MVLTNKNMDKRDRSEEIYFYTFSEIRDKLIPSEVGKKSYYKKIEEHGPSGLETNRFRKEINNWLLKKGGACFNEWEMFPGEVIPSHDCLMYFDVEIGRINNKDDFYYYFLAISHIKLNNGTRLIELFCAKSEKDPENEELSRQNGFRVMMFIFQEFPAQRFEIHSVPSAVKFWKGRLGFKFTGEKTEKGLLIAYIEAPKVKKQRQDIESCASCYSQENVNLLDLHTGRTFCSHACFDYMESKYEERNKFQSLFYFFVW